MYRGIIRRRRKENELFYRYCLAPFCEACNPYRPAFCYQRDPAGHLMPRWVPFWFPLTLDSVMKVIILRKTHTANKAFCLVVQTIFWLVFRHRSRYVNDSVQTSPRALPFFETIERACPFVFVFFPPSYSSPSIHEPFASVLIVFLLCLPLDNQKIPVRSHFSMRRGPWFTSHAIGAVE